MPRPAIHPRGTNIHPGTSRKNVTAQAPTPGPSPKHRGMGVSRKTGIGLHHPPGLATGVEIMIWPPRTESSHYQRPDISINVLGPNFYRETPISQVRHPWSNRVTIPYFSPGRALHTHIPAPAVRGSGSWGVRPAPPECKSRPGDCPFSVDQTGCDPYNSGWEHNFRVSPYRGIFFYPPKPPA